MINSDVYVYGDRGKEIHLKYRKVEKEPHNG